MIAIRMARSLVVYSTETPWPSGLRRGIKVPVRKGAGSNPAGVNFFFSIPSLPSPSFCTGTSSRRYRIQRALLRPKTRSGLEDMRVGVQGGPHTLFLPVSRNFCNTKYAYTLFYRRNLLTNCPLGALFFFCQAYYWVSRPFFCPSRVPSRGSGRVCSWPEAV